MANRNPNYAEVGWKPGQSGNPNGRPVGSRNNRTKEVVEQILALGLKDPLVTLAELQATDPDSGIRATAANMLAPYLHSKLAAKPQPPDPVYIEQAVNLPRPISVRQASDNIALLSEMKAQGKIDIATADNLINDQKVILYALLDEQKLLTAQGGAPEQVIRIEGGLPELPGTNIIMPTPLNGHDLQLEATPAIRSPARDQPTNDLESPPSNQEP
jgi:hypothetical protein